MKKDIQTYNNKQSAADKKICEVLRKEINKKLPEEESKVWHGQSRRG